MWIDLQQAKYLKEKLNIPDCTMAIRVDRRVVDRDGNEKSFETRYFITSVPDRSVSNADIAAIIRNHWQIENQLHFRKDRWWDEDRHHTRRPGLSSMLAAINNAALSVHQVLSDPTLPIRASADYLCWTPENGIKLLFS